MNFELRDEHPELPAISIEQAAGFWPISKVLTKTIRKFLRNQIIIGESHTDTPNTTYAPHFGPTLIRSLNQGLWVISPCNCWSRLMTALFY